MARPLRVDVVDGVYHVVSRGNDRQALFKDDKERLKDRKDRGQVEEDRGQVCTLNISVDDPGTCG